MLVDKGVEQRRRVQLLGVEHLAGVGIGALCPDLAVVADDELARKALLQHVRVVVHVVERDDQRLLTLGQHQRVAPHALLAALGGVLAPHVLHCHEDVALVIDALQDLVVLVHRAHPVVEAVALRLRGRALVECVLRIGDDRVEEQMLHHLIRPPRLRQLLRLPVVLHRLVGVDIGLRLRFLRHRRRVGVRRVGRVLHLLRLVRRARRRILPRAAGGQQAQDKRQRKKKRRKAFHENSDLSQKLL